MKKASIGDIVISKLTGRRLVVVKVCFSPTFAHGYMVQDSGFTFFLEKRYALLTNEKA